MQTILSFLLNPLRALTPGPNGANHRRATQNVNAVWDLAKRTVGLPMAMRFFAPYVGAGVQVSKPGPGASPIEVHMPLTFLNTNYVGTHFGGSLYSMCDPFYMFILMESLGEDYIVWDKSATIDFLKPGTGTVSARFEIAPEIIAEIKQLVAERRKIDYVFETDILNEAGEAVAHLQKTLYVRRAPGKKASSRSV